MVESFPKLRIELIQKQGRQIIHRIREDLDKSSTLMLGAEARNQLLQKAKDMVDADRSGLLPVEKGILLQYVRDGITGEADPDSRLYHLTAEQSKSPQSASFPPDANRGTSQTSVPARPKSLHLILIIFLAFIGSFYGRHAARNSLHHFVSPDLTGVKISDQIDYRLNLRYYPYYAYIPKGYDGSKPYGLMVYMSSQDDVTQLPSGWRDVLDKRNIILIAPQDAGNSKSNEKRMGLGVLGALAAMKEYKIAPNQVYAVGLSAGARVAEAMAINQTGLFAGTIQSCGADFYKGVPHLKGKDWIDSNGNRYGLVEAAASDVLIAKKDVRFVLITGPGDFRYGNLLDLYEGGFRPNGFQCKFIDDPKMGHQDCSAESLNQAIDFISRK